MSHPISPSCKDEKCHICMQPATHKVAEETQGNEMRHEYTAYVCCEHFSFIFGEWTHPTEWEKEQEQHGSKNNMEALKIVQKFFPNVTSVKDAKEPLTIEVTKQDTKSAKVKNHQACAMAVACKRAMKADGVIVSVNRVYVIDGNQAVRYSIPESVSREVVSFDRDAGFSPGQYQVVPVEPSLRLGMPHSGAKANTGNGKKPVLRHQTTGIRTVLGSKL